MSVNKCILIGNCGKDPEVRNIQGGGKVATVTLATTEKFKDREETEWHTIVFWNNLAEVVEKYVSKGSPIYVEGRIKTEKFTGKDGTDKFMTRIIASSLQLLGKKESNPATPSQPRTPLYQQAVQVPVPPAPAPEDGDLPF